MSRIKKYAATFRFGPNAYRSHCRAPEGVSWAFAVEITCRVSDQARVGVCPVRPVAKLTVNGKSAGETRIAAFEVSYFETLDVGSDFGSPVSPDYTCPFRFTGKLETARADL